MTRYEMERIATLAHNQAYKALLKMLDESDNLLLEKIETASGDKERELLDLWKASRRFKKLIAGTPEAFYAEVGGIPNTF